MSMRGGSTLKNFTMQRRLTSEEHSGSRHSFGARDPFPVNTVYTLHALHGPGTSALSHPTYKWRLGYFASFVVLHQKRCSE